MAMTKSRRSVTTTPHKPDVAEYRAVAAPAKRTTSYFDAPSSTPPILMANLTLLKLPLMRQQGTHTMALQQKVRLLRQLGLLKMLT